MKYWILATAIFPATLAQAALYKYSVSASDRGGLNHAKNCIDYQVCADSSSSLNLDALRFHVRVELNNDAEAQKIAQNCDFKTQKVSVVLVNEDTSKQISIDSAGPSDLFKTAELKNLYVPHLKFFDKVSLTSQVKKLSRKGQGTEAIRLIIDTLQLNPYDYQVIENPAFKDIAVTDHETKVIGFAPSFFNEPCDLIRGVRHELEHVTQFRRATACIAVGKAHSLTDHVERERSAHLNDIYNVERYCPKKGRTRTLIDHDWERITTSYLRP